MPKLWYRRPGIHINTSRLAILIVLPRICDMHVHWRQDEIEGDRVNFMSYLAPISAEYCTDVLLMTNTIPWVDDYKKWIEEGKKVSSVLTHFPHCRPIIVMMVSQKTTPEDIAQAAFVGVTDFKAMPAGLTTHSKNGITNYHVMLPVWQAIARVKGRLHLHGELPGAHVDQACRVTRFVNEVLWWLRMQCLDLDIIVEHISKKAEIDFIRDAQRYGPGKTFGTVTLQHIEKHVNDLMGDKFNADLFCKPLYGGPADQQAIYLEVTSGVRYLGLGSDSAFHPWWEKHTNECCAGVFTAPVLIQRLLMIWEERYGNVESLSEEERMHFYKTLVAFTSENAVKFFNLPPADIARPVYMKKESWQVPASYFGGIAVPYRALETFTWRMLSSYEIKHN